MSDRMLQCFCLAALLIFVAPINAANCFLVKENERAIICEGDTESRHPPCSTFKIAISLMAFDQGLLEDEENPTLPFQDGFVDDLEMWRQPHNPRMWIQNSCVWFSQILTKQMGMETFQDYVEAFEYGNQDLTGENALTRVWLSNSLEISPEEQTAFLQKMLNGELLVSARTHEMTRNILFVEDFGDGWSLFGKTGAGTQHGRDVGWFVGWLEKEERQIVFANFLEDEKRQDTYTSFRARAAAKTRLKELLDVV